MIPILALSSTMDAKSDVFVFDWSFFARTIYRWSDVFEINHTKLLCITMLNGFIKSVINLQCFIINVFVDDLLETVPRGKVS